MSMPHMVDSSSFWPLQQQLNVMPQKRSSLQAFFPPAARLRFSYPILRFNQLDPDQATPCLHDGGGPVCSLRRYKAAMGAQPIRVVAFPC